MNYRHQFHAGNFADVMKHALLVALLRAMQRKEKGFLFLDTHAGRGGYDLETAAAGDSLARKPEWPDGIGRIGAGASRPPAIQEYAALVGAFDREAGNLAPGVRFYPGSPWFGRRLARPQDRLVLCEKHPAECAALRVACARFPRTSVHEMDGYVAVRAMLPPPERRALVLLDPPFEAQDEFAQITAALDEGLRRLPGGVFAVWFPLTQRARVEEFFAGLRALPLPPTLIAELAIVGDEAPMKMKGCGLVVLNPPWQFERETEALLAWLAPVLAQAPGGGGHVTWLVPERD